MTSEQKPSKIKNVTLWAIQGFMGLMLAWSGFMKVVNPAGLPYPWIRESPNLALTTGIFDLLGGLGIILPALLRIKPVLTVYAAYGIIALMFSAIVFHLSRGEANVIGFNVIFIFLAAFVAWGRRVKVVGN